VHSGCWEKGHSACRRG